MDDKGLINSQEEYDLELAWFKSELKVVYHSIYNPQVALNKFNTALDRAEKIGLFSHEDCTEYRNKMNRAMNSDTLKQAIKDKLKKFRGK